jgi:peptide/nickel transport system permease protein
MHWYVVRRIALMVPTLLGMTVVVFTLTRVVPADPARAAAGIAATEATVEALRHELRLDRPLPVQYVWYLRGLLKGDLGRSMYSGRLVSQEIVKYIPATTELALVAFFMLCLIGVPLGIFAAARQGRVLDVASRGLAIGTAALPVFWLGLVLQFVFFYRLRLLPLIGRTTTVALAPREITGMYLVDALLTQNWTALVDTLRHMILPVLTLVASRIGIVVRLTRVCVLDELEQDYVRTARAKGLGNSRVLAKHALRNAAVPIITELGMQFSWLLAGSAVVESIFVWPGVGLYALRSIVMLDFNPIMAFTLIATFAFLVSNLVVDLTYALANPRVRLE